MKQTLQYIAKSIALLGLIIIQTSCLREDPGDCQSYLTLHFSYTHNTEEKDLFTPEVNSLSLYIFDTDGYLTGSIPVSRSDLNNGNRYTLPLEEGDYAITVWGNAESEFYEISKSVDHGEMTLSLKTDESGEHLIPGGDLFYGTTHISLMAKEKREVEVPLIKSSNKVSVLFKGNDLRVNITGSNGVLDFENNSAGKTSVAYKPTYSTTEHGGEEYNEGAFRVLRLVAGDDTSIVLSREGETLREDNLVAFIMENFPEIKTDDDLDRHCEYLFVYDYDKSGNYTLSFIRAGEWSASFGQSGGI